MNREKKDIKKRKKSPAVRQKVDGVASLVAEVRKLIVSARHAAASTINTLQVLTNFEIGRRIFEHEQKGKKRAKYGAELLKELSARLTEEFGKGFSVSNLQLMRQFFIEFSPRIQQTPSVKLTAAQKYQTPSDELPSVQVVGIPAGKLPFTLSWSHYVLLLTIKDPDERNFYEIEAANEGWSLSELKRQKDAIVELTLPKDANIHAREYQLYLPSKELLRTKLIEWTREAETVKNSEVSE